MTKKNFFLGLLAASVLGAAAALGGYKILFKETRYDTFDDKQNVRFANYAGDVVVPEGLNFVYAAEAATPAVVHVRTMYERGKDQSEARGFEDSPFGDMFKDFFGGQGNIVPPQPMAGSGSGVIISDDGYIVTNNHVVGDADKIQVVLNDRRSYEAKVIGTDPNTDLALIKIEEKNLPFLKFGDSDKLKIGEWVLAVGNPFDLTSTVTAGIVSAKARNINILAREGNQYAIESFIQTDAAVNPGNSGGALVNLKGELVGINSAIATRTGTFNGYSFAVPSDLTKKVMDDLLKYGEVQRGLLGVSIRTVDADLAKEKKIKEIKGVYVNDVNAESAAEEAGLKGGDIIVQINNIVVNSVSELQDIVGRYRPGDKVEITYLRNGQEKKTSAKLRNKMGNTEVVKREEVPVINALGAEIEPISKDEMSRLKIKGGVKVLKINSGKLREAGIKPGFIITAVNKKSVKNPKDLKNILLDERGRLLIEGYTSDGREAYYVVD